MEGNKPISSFWDSNCFFVVSPESLIQSKEVLRDRTLKPGSLRRMVFPLLERSKTLKWEKDSSGETQRVRVEIGRAVLELELHYPTDSCGAPTLSERKRRVVILRSVKRVFPQ